MASILAGLGGILIASIFASYIVTLYWERVRLSKLAQQCIPYLRDLKTSLRLSVAALCLGLKCPFLDLGRLGSPDLGLIEIEGREKEIREWFRGIQNGDALESPNVAEILKCLNHIANMYIKSPLERLRAASHLFEDKPSIRDDFFTIEHNINVARILFSTKDMVSMPPRGQEILGHMGGQLVDLLRQVTVALEHE